MTMVLGLLAGALILVMLGVAAGIFIRKRLAEGSVKEAENAAQRLMEEAKRDAETIKIKAALLMEEASIKAAEKAYQAKKEFESETSEKRKEYQAIEKRFLQKEESLDKKFESIERRDEDVAKREKACLDKEKTQKESEDRLKALIEERQRKLEDMSGMSSEEAKRLLLEAVENDARLESGRVLKRIEEETLAEAEKKAKEIIALAIQRYAGEYAAEKTVSVVNLPNDEMKGRIIGREGRNIRAIEAITGVEIIVDDTPEAVILSGHNPVRREIAKIAIERLVSDGRIHPARIEEIVGKVTGEVEKTMQEAGEKAVFDTGLHGIHPELQKLIGRLRFRTSYAQNVYAHSMEVAFICGIMAGELGLQIKLARRAGLLHDIGKAVDHEVEGPHALIGADLAKKYGENQKITDAIAQHHDDKPQTMLGVLVQAADTLSAARPGARKEMYETYVKRLEDLEGIAKSFSGVEKSYALQAGRELRVIVESSIVDDNTAALLSRDIAKKIEKELSYPGQIRVTVIRETRAVDYAK